MVVIIDPGFNTLALLNRSCSQGRFIHDQSDFVPIRVLHEVMVAVNAHDFAFHRLSKPLLAAAQVRRS